MQAPLNFRSVLLAMSFVAASTTHLFAQANDPGSYTLTVPPGISPIANHLDRGANTVGDVLPNVPEGTLLYKFDVVQIKYSVNQFQSGAWLRPGETLAPGEGALLRNSGAEFSLVFSGTKPGSTAFPKLNGGLNLVSLPVPGETAFPVPNDGDKIWRFDFPAQRFLPSTYDGVDKAWLAQRLDLSTLARHGVSFFYRDHGIPSNPPDPADIWGPQIYLSTLISGVVDARVVSQDGSVVGPGLKAQLYAGPAGTATELLTPLSPSTTVETAGALEGHVNPVVVTVPQTLVSWGASATLVLRVFDGESYDSSTVRGQSAPITIPLGIALNPPINLAGLQGFSIPPAVPSEGRIKVERTANGLILTYTGTLQSANEAGGPYVDVIGAGSPASLTFEGTAKFYRLKP